jgi:hypothetical protein
VEAETHSGKSSGLTSRLDDGDECDYDNDDVSIHYFLSSSYFLLLFCVSLPPFHAAPFFT